MSPKVRFGFLALIIFLALPGRARASPQTEKPLTQSQLMDLVKAGMETSDLVKLIREHGIDFDLTADCLQALRKAGAQERVIQALDAARPKPLTKEQILELLTGHVPSARAATLVKQRGIDFVTDEAYLETVRLAGADDALISALREASKAVMWELYVTTASGAAISLDGIPQGQADARGHLTLKASPGSHALKVSLKGTKNFEEKVVVADPQGVKISAWLAYIGPSPGRVSENPIDGLRYVGIAPGTFMMGCSPGDHECAPDEQPIHQVTITRGFWLGQTDVTVGAYKRFAAATGRQMPPSPAFDNGWVSETMPIVEVTWDDAKAYCEWMGGRLPAEAEWEYAARAGSTEIQYGAIDEVAWYVDNSAGRTRDVAQKRPNGFGLYDMLGNVWEWVNDWYDESYYQKSPSHDPFGPSSGENRVVRGGAWNLNPSGVRVSVRLHYGPGYGFNDLGFRCGG